MEVQLHLVDSSAFQLNFESNGLKIWQEMRSNKVGERPTKIQSSTKQTSLGFEHPSFPMPPFLPSLFYKNFRNIFVQQKDENLKKPKLNYVVLSRTKCRFCREDIPHNSMHHFPTQKK